MSLCPTLGTAVPCRTPRGHVPRAGLVAGRHGHRRPVWRRLPWWGEIATISLFYVAYEVLRVASTARAGEARAHAGQVLRLEGWAHLDVEGAADRWLAGFHGLSTVAGYWYLTAHFVVTPAVLALAWWKAPRGYAALRSALVLTSSVALAVFRWWPLAPPRLAVAGVVDTLGDGSFYGTTSSHGASGLVNAYAAMPSLHVGWAVWCAVAAVVLMRSRWRHLAWLYPLLTTAVVLATGNHYVLDAVAGAALTAVAVLATWTSR